MSDLRLNNYQNYPVAKPSIIQQSKKLVVTSECQDSVKEGFLLGATGGAVSGAMAGSATGPGMIASAAGGALIGGILSAVGSSSCGGPL